MSSLINYNLRPESCIKLHYSSVLRESSRVTLYNIQDFLENILHTLGKRRNCMISKLHIYTAHKTLSRRGSRLFWGRKASIAVIWAIIELLIFQYQRGVLLKVYILYTHNQGITWRVPYKQITAGIAAEIFDATLAKLLEKKFKLSTTFRIPLPTYSYWWSNCKQCPDWCWCA